MQVETNNIGLAGGEHLPLIEQCQGCDRALVDGHQSICQVFPNPAIKWRLGPCVMATHIKAEVKGDSAKARVGQQKQKKK